MRKIYFPNIDGLRTLAIVPVIWWHFIGFPQPQYDLPDFLKLFAALIPPAHTGVRLFFVISGFLISYLLFEEKKRQKINILNFYKRRILRIWPLYFLVLFFGFVLLPIFNILFAENPPFNSHYIPYEHFWQYLFFLANYDLIFNHQTSPILTVLWSVSVEEQFYLFWPLIIYFFNRKQLSFAFATITLASFLWRWKFIDSPNYYYYHTFACMFDLCVGAIAAYLAFYYPSFKEKLQKLNKYPLLLIYLAGLMLLYLPTIFSLNTQKYIVIGDCLLAVFFGFIIIEQSFTKYSFFKIGQFKFVSKIGKYTYSLYSLHLIVIFIFVGTLKYFELEIIPKNLLMISIQILGGVLFSLIVSYCSYRYLETPFLKLKDKL